MNRIARTAVAATGLAAIAVPTTIALAGPASADVERTGTCRAATFELNVDKEDGRFEVDGDIDRAAAGTQWRIQLSHEGSRFVNVVRTADREGEIELAERLRNDTAGADTFTMTVQRVGNFNPCSVTVVTR